MKSGISLIAVLMFMLAATTASIVIFRYIGQENFSSAARLKSNEAYQASQAGLEAVQGWLTNKGADAGALLRAFEIKGANNPMLLVSKNGSNSVDLLGGMQSNRQQKFEVYLIGVNTENQPYKLKFLSVGTARDGSKYSQSAIFDVEGLYKMKGKGPPDPPESPNAPTYHGGIGGGTQGSFTSANIIGDLNSYGGLSSTGDMIITGSVKTEGTSNREVGCPGNEKPRDNAPPSNYAAMVKDEIFGNTYVKEDWYSQMTGFCGSVYVGGNFNSHPFNNNNGGDIAVWGSLYVGGNLDAADKKLTVYGNLTVGGCITNYKGDRIDIRGNLVIKGNCPAWDPEKTWDPIGTCTKGVCGTLWEGRNNSDDPPSNLLANNLAYLGSQLVQNKDGKWTIPDPIMLGFADLWKKSELPAGCTDLKNYATNDVITLNSTTNDQDFITAVNKCHNNRSVGNWSDAIDEKWLVLRVNWEGININNNKFLGELSSRSDFGNFIIVVENKPNIKLPKTTEKTNVLMYLTRGAQTIQINSRNTGEYYNYFIYSEADIEEIDGNQYLTGNLFMANGAKVKKMQDPKIEANDRLYEALIKAGAIKKKLGGGGGTLTDISLPTGLDPALDPALSYVPAGPHLKVTMQSIYASANEENPTNPDNAMPAILVMPRIIYLQPSQVNNSLTNYFKVLYLNGASQPTADLNQQIKNCGGISADKSLICNLDLSAAACGGSKLCNNAFYVIVGK